MLLKKFHTKDFDENIIIANCPVEFIYIKKIGHWLHLGVIADITGILTILAPIVTLLWKH